MFNEKKGSKKSCLHVPKPKKMVMAEKIQAEEVREKLQNVKSRAYERTLTLVIRGRIRLSVNLDVFVMITIF